MSHLRYRLKSYQYRISCQPPSSNKIPEQQRRHAHNMTHTLHALICAFHSRLNMIRISDYQNIFHVLHFSRNRSEYSHMEGIRLKKYPLQEKMFISCVKLALRMMIKK